MDTGWRLPWTNETLRTQHASPPRADVLLSEHDPRPAPASPDRGHQPSSSEGGGAGPAGGGEAGGVEAASPPSPGEGGSGELERVPGFNESALDSGGGGGGRAGARVVPVSPELENLPDAGALEYASPETVCGSDERTQITNTTAIAWRWICQLVLKFRDGTSARGTGWFIGPHTVMTAGHCVYSHSHGGWAQSIEVIPGHERRRQAIRQRGKHQLPQRDGLDRLAQRQPGIRLRGDHPAQRHPGEPHRLVRLRRPHGRALNNLLVNLSGYAGDKPFGTQWFMAGNISNVEARRLRYMVDSFGGQSGSPVWRLNNGQRHAVGIHAYGGCPNGATRIIQDVYDNMVAWKA